MKLLRYGEPGAERPGMLGPEGEIRDLSAHLDDITGAVLDDSSLEWLARIDPGSLPEVAGSPRLGPPVGGVGKFIGIGL
ncbi:MAG: 2-hydroxyhepta-2,4-diene-1,7-dioate isomerase, partial [Alphaproteobacteria bacterium]